MYRFILSIISFLCIFSIYNISYASSISKGSLDNLLNISYGPELYELNLIQVNVYSNPGSNLRAVQNELYNTSTALRGVIIQKYQNGDYDYYTMRALVKNYKTFIYYANDILFYLNLIDLNPHMSGDYEVQKSISSDYKNLRVYFEKVAKQIR